MSESVAAAKRRQRRIPDEFRKRNAQSCDLCRKRRCRCVPAPGGDGCITCREHNVPCAFTAPRKTRFYGSVDDLSDRYRCLEAIVKGAFPNDPTATAAELLQLGQRMGYSMPDLSGPSRPSISIEDLVRAPDSRGSTAQAGSTTTGTSISGQGISPSSEQGASTGTTTGPSTEGGPEEPGSGSDEAHLSLIRDTSGNEHYIGPSGTLNFLSQLRRLIVSSHVAPASAQHAEGVSKFTQDDTAQALEADDSQEQQQEETQQEIAAAAQSSADGPQDGPSPGSITSSIAKDFTRTPVVDLEDTLRSLPSDDTLEQLIHSYFKNVHDDFPLFHRATFEDEYELYVVQARRRLQMQQMQPMQGRRPVPDWGWIGSLHMIIVFGSISNPRIPGVDHSMLRRRSVAAARTLLPQFISKCTLSNVRVLLLLSLFLHNNNERNAAWNLVGTATRIAFALGLHRSDMSSNFRPLEREVRKWVFCTLYAFEQFLASSLGRPSGLQEMDVEILPPREGFLDCGSGTDAKLVFMSLKLQGILAKARFTYARPRKVVDTGPQDTDGPAKPTIEDILKALNSWRAEVAQNQNQSFNLPSIRTRAQICGKMEDANAMDFDELKMSLSWKTRAQLRAVLLLHIQYHYIAIVATRPILLREIASAQRRIEEDRETDEVPMSPISDICLYHAAQLTYLVLLLDSFQLVNGLSGLDIFYAYCAAMVLILRLLRRPLGSDEEVETAADASGAADPSSPASASASASKSREAQVQVLIKDLVLRVQAVINNVEKSGSMKRFAKVVDAFAECTSQTGRLRLESTRRQAMGNVWSRGLPPGMVPQNGQAYPHPLQGGIPAAPAPAPEGMGGPGSQQQAVGGGSMATPQNGGMMGMGGGPPVNSVQMDIPMSLWPLSTFGTPGVQLDEGFYYNAYNGNEPTAAPEWGDMEMVLASYGIP